MGSLPPPPPRVLRKFIVCLSDFKKIKTYVIERKILNGSFSHVFLETHKLILLNFPELVKSNLFHYNNFLV